MCRNEAECVSFPVLFALFFSVWMKMNEKRMRLFELHPRLFYVSSRLFEVLPRLFMVSMRLFDVSPRLFSLSSRLFDVSPRLFYVSSRLIGLQSRLFYVSSGLFWDYSRLFKFLVIKGFFNWIKLPFFSFLFHLSKLCLFFLLTHFFEQSLKNSI